MEQRLVEKEIAGMLSSSKGIVTTSKVARRRGSGGRMSNL